MFILKKKIYSGSYRTFTSKVDRVEVLLPSQFSTVQVRYCHRRTTTSETTCVNSEETVQN
jgi:hypothetical protein